MRAVRRIDQLRGDTDTATRFAHRAFEHIADAQFMTDPLNVGGLALVDKARIARDDKQPAYAGKRSDDLFDHAVGEIFLLRVAAHILERQNRNRWFVRKRDGSGHPQDFLLAGAQDLARDLVAATWIESLDQVAVRAAGLAQAFEHMRVVFRPHPRHARMDTALERGRRDGYGLVQRFVRLFDPAALAEGSGEPTVGVRKIGV